MNNEPKNELQKLIVEVLKENPEIEFRTCKKCGTELPLHIYFFPKRKANNKYLFKHKCKICEYGRNGYGYGNNGHKRNEILLNNITSEQLIEIYEEILSGKRNIFPSGMSKNPNNIKILIRYLFLNKLNINKDDDFIGLKFAKIIDDYKLYRLYIHTMGTGENLINDIIEYFPEFKIYPWLFFTPKFYFWEDDKNVKITTKWFIDKLIEDNIIKSINDLPNVLSVDLMIKYRIYKILKVKFNNCLYDYLNYICPNKWKPYDLRHTTPNYFKDINNVVSAVKWLTQDILKYKKREDYLELKKDDFYNNNLITIFNQYKGSIYTILCLIFPEYNFREWEMSSTSNGFWKKRINRVKSLKELIEEKLKLELDQIPSVLSYSYLRDCHVRFCAILEIYYNYNIYSWVNECYPNVFKPDNFNILIAKDNTKVSSKDELILHNYFIDYLYNHKIVYKGNKRDNMGDWYNKEYNENYIPDWIINDNIIVEYFGWYDIKKYNQHVKFKDYINKTHRKIEYYNKNCEIFIALYPEDLKFNLKGVKKKLSFLINN